jgi:hypothetical protein
LSLLKPHTVSKISDPSQVYFTNKRALTKFIKKTIKDNPEPFRGYLEISNTTQHLKKQQEQILKNQISSQQQMLMAD